MDAGIGTRPSRKAVKSLLKRIHERTARRSYADTPENTVADLSRLLHWLVRRTGDYGRGFERFTQEYLHDTLGLYRIPRRRADLPRAKV